MNITNSKGTRFAAALVAACGLAVMAGCPQQDTRQGTGDGLVTPGPHGGTTADTPGRTGGVREGITEPGTGTGTGTGGY
jgi:hypothetical protein